MLLLTSGFFLLQNVFFQTMSTYIPLELQFSADHSFLGNYALKMYGFWDTGGQSPQWHHHFSEEFFFFFFFGHILTYITLESQFNAWQSFLRNHSLNIFGFRGTGVKADDDITIFLTNVLIFPDISIYLPWILCRSKSSWDSSALF